MERAALCVWLFLAGSGAQVTPAPPTVCEAGKYGAQCELTCSANCQGGACDKGTGACSGGCKPGWVDPQCNTPCPEGKYGQDCTGTCGRCQGGSAKCSKDTGHCAEGCVPGYIGERCDAPCQPGQYGQDCQSPCGRCRPEGTTCNPETGVCPNGCLPGFLPPVCQNDCKPGGWAEDCLKVCSEHCQDPSTCNKETGHCACKPGYQPPLCTEQCDAGRYGQDCSGQCGECLDGDADCDHVTGNCTHCKESRQMPLCQECIPGRLGATCSKECEHCGGDGRCHRQTGVCLSSVCLPGWTSPTCTRKCPPGFYGQDCARKCGHCQHDTPCRHDNGVCEVDCEDDYEGALCQRSKANLAGAVVGAVMGAGALIAIAIVVSVCFIKRRSRFKPISQSKEDITIMGDIPSADPEEAPGTPQTSGIYQNVQVNHVGGQDEAANPPAPNYDRPDLSKRAEEVHHYESHTALTNASTPSPPVQQDDHLYQNPTDVMATPAPEDEGHVTAAPAPPPEEPEATYGNL